MYFLARNRVHVVECLADQSLTQPGCQSREECNIGFRWLKRCGERFDEQRLIVGVRSERRDICDSIACARKA
jgi:hypothetical protein